jgi:hypothetical protein
MPVAPPAGGAPPRPLAAAAPLAPPLPAELDSPPRAAFAAPATTALGSNKFGSLELEHELNPTTPAPAATIATARTPRERIMPSKGEQQGHLLQISLEATLNSFFRAVHPSKKPNRTCTAGVNRPGVRSGVREGGEPPASDRLKMVLVFRDFKMRCSPPSPQSAGFASDGACGCYPRCVCAASRRRGEKHQLGQPSRLAHVNDSWRWKSAGLLAAWSATCLVIVP